MKNKSAVHVDVSAAQCEAKHPNHSSQLPRLKRIKGQIEGIERMINDRRYCPDIIYQIRASAAALKAVEAEMFKNHLRECVRNAFTSEPEQFEEKVQEIMKLMY